MNEKLRAVDRLMQGGDYRAALHHLDAILAAQAARPNPDALNRRGICHAELDQHLAAVTDFRAALALMPKAVGYWCNLARSQSALGRTAEAEESLRTALMIQHDFLPAWRALAQLLTDTRQWEKLTGLGEGELAQCNPLLALRCRFIAATGQGKTEAALSLGDTLIDQLQQLQQGDKEFLESYVALTLSAGKPQAALSAIEKQRAFVDDIRWLDLLQAQVAWHGHKDADFARQAAQRAIASGCQVHRAHLLLAQIDNDQGLLGQAMGHLETALQVSPDWAPARLEWLRLKIVLGDYHACLNDDSLPSKHGTDLDADALWMFMALAAYLADDIGRCVASLQKLYEKPVKHYSGQNARVVVAYGRYLKALLDSKRRQGSSAVRQLMLIGDSHCIAAHRLHLNHHAEDYQCISRLIMGAKAWHLGSKCLNFYQAAFTEIVRDISSETPLVLFFGEIDCRPDEGIWPHWRQNPAIPLHDRCKRVVADYLQFIRRHLPSRQPLWVVGVPAPCGKRLSLVAGNEAEFIGMVRSFNEALAEAAADVGAGFVDVWSVSASESGIGIEERYLDGVHLRPEVVLKAIEASLEKEMIRKHRSGSAIRAKPESPERKAAVQRFRNGDAGPLRTLCDQILAKDPYDRFALINRGVLHTRDGEIEQAISLYRRGVERYPDDANLHANLARALGERRDWAGCYRHARRATELDPSLAVAWVNLSWGANMCTRYEEAVAASQKAIQLNPDQYEPYLNLASSLKEMGRMDECLATYRQLIQRFPDRPDAYTNLLLALLYHDDSSLNDVLQVAKEFANRFESPFSQDWPDWGAWDSSPFRKLRVGFVSPDFNDHSVMYFLEPILAGMDRQQFEIHCYYCYPEGSGDHITTRVRRYADRFVFIGGLKPAQQAESIRSDKVDILVDLAGHTARNALLAVARKPAPLIMTWLGYPGTTGLAAIDWRITDSVADVDWERLRLEGADEAELAHIPPLKSQYSEKLAFLPPPFCVYRPCIRHPLARYWPRYQVQPPPAKRKGYITFGSCNNLAKLNERVLRLWGRLLQRLPTARLLIEGKGLQVPSVADALRAKCVAHGLPAERLILLPRVQANQYLTYHDIDIALDTFPQTGGTTTFDVLWMGVPVVTMRGLSFRSRMGMSFLKAAGLAEWIAGNEDEYLAIAEHLASDVDALQRRRLTQRSMIEQSPLMNEQRFVRLFEELLRQAWLKWCARQVAGDDTTAQQAQFEQWLAQRPKSAPPTRRVFLAPGEGMPLPEALARLANLLQQAQASTTAKDNPSPAWQELIAWARGILESVPNQAQALAALAEAEYAHGHQAAALSYLYHAIKAAPDLLSLQLRWQQWQAAASSGATPTEEGQ